MMFYSPPEGPPRKAPWDGPVDPRSNLDPNEIVDEILRGEPSGDTGEERGLVREVLGPQERPLPERPPREPTRVDDMVETVLAGPGRESGWTPMSAQTESLLSGQPINHPVLGEAPKPNMEVMIRDILG